MHALRTTGIIGPFLLVVVERGYWSSVFRAIIEDAIPDPYQKRYVCGFSTGCVDFQRVVRISGKSCGFSTGRADF